MADYRIASGTQAASQFLSELDALLRCRLQQRLGVRIQHPVAHALEVGGNHPVYRIAAATADPDHLDACRLARHNPARNAAIGRIV